MAPSDSDLVTLKIQRLWRDPQDRARAREVLDAYVIQPQEAEEDRVQLAVLKLSGGQLSELARMIEAANRDSRDVLLWAENPEEANASWALRPDLSQEDKERLADLRDRDRSQYLQWRRD